MLSVFKLDIPKVNIDIVQILNLDLFPMSRMNSEPQLLSRHQRGVH